MAMEELGRELGWDDEIVNDSEEFVLLPDGDYYFEVVGMERSRFDGSAKMAPCNMAVLSVKLTGDAGSTTIKDKFFLNSKAEWRLCQFYTAIGFRKKGEPLKMQWGKVVGTSGFCKVKTRSWTNDNGKEYHNNEIEKYYDPAEYKPAAPAPQAPASGGWKPGQF